MDLGFLKEWTDILDHVCIGTKVGTYLLVYLPAYMPRIDYEIQVDPAIFVGCESTYPVQLLNFGIELPVDRIIRIATFTSMYTFLTISCTELIDVFWYLTIIGI